MKFNSRDFQMNNICLCFMYKTVNLRNKTNSKPLICAVSCLFSNLDHNKYYTTQLLRNFCTIRFKTQSFLMFRYFVYYIWQMQIRNTYVCLYFIYLCLMIVFITLVYDMIRIKLRTKCKCYDQYLINQILVSPLPH